MMQLDQNSKNMTPEQQVKMIIGDLVLQVSNQALMIEQLQAQIKELTPKPDTPPDEPKT